jgi:hypothetical protein
MTSTIESRIQALHGFPINEEITSDYEQYRLWFIANFTDQITDKDAYEDRGFEEHVEHIARLAKTGRDEALHHIREGYLGYLDERSNRLSAIVQDLHTDRFSGYAAAVNDYLDGMNTAMADHLGLAPDTVTESDVDAIHEIYEHLRSAVEVTKPYGYSTLGDSAYSADSEKTAQ